MIDFPLAPVDGQMFAAPNGVLYMWRANPGAWLVDVATFGSVTNTYISIRALGGSPDAVDNVGVIAAANTLGRPVYFDNADYKTSILPTVPVFGEGRIVFTGGDLSTPPYEAIELSYIPSYVNAIVQGIGETTRQRHYNLIDGQYAGRSIDYATVYGVTGFGGHVFEVTTGGQRSNAFGKSAFRDVIAPEYSDAIGDSAGQCATFADRSVFIGANAGKWAGCADPVGKKMDLFLVGSPAGDPRYGPLWPDWRSIVGPVEGPSMLVADANADNYGNIAVGRDTFGHNITGQYNTLVGMHGPRGWDMSFTSTLGGEAGRYLLDSTNAEFIGYSAGQNVITTNDVFVGGSFALGSAVHPKNGVYIGARVAAALYGNSLDRLTATDAIDANVMVGVDGARSATTGKRNTLVGNLFADASLYVEDSVTVGYRALNLATGINKAVALGYRAGDLMSGNLLNVVVIGANANAGGSNTGKIGQALTDLSISGRTYTTYNQTTASNTTGIVLTPDQILQARFTRTGPTADFTDTLPSAAALVAAIPGAEVGTSFETNLWNDSLFTQTIAAGTGVTLGRTIALKAGAFVKCRGRITSVTAAAETYTFTFEHPGTLWLDNGGTDKPTLFSERNGSGYHVIFTRAGVDRGSINITSQGAALNGLGVPPQLGYAADSGVATPTAYWQLNITGSGAVLGALRPVTDGAADLGTTAARVAGIHQSVVTVAALPAGTTFMRHVVSDASVAAAGNFGAAVVGGGANNVPVYRDTGGTWRIG